MATINYAIVLTEEAKSGEEQLVVRHLYHHLADAKGCAAAYRRDLDCDAAVAVIDPPLAVVRGGDAWGVLEADATLHVYASQREALEAAASCGRFVAIPIRRAMPVNHGTPQFAAVPSPPSPPLTSA